MAPIGLRRNGDDSILQCCLLYQRLLQGHQVADNMTLTSGMSCQMLTGPCCVQFVPRLRARTLSTLLQAAQQHVNHTDTLVLLTDDENLRGKAHAAGITAHRSDSLSPRSAHDHLLLCMTLEGRINADMVPPAMEHSPGARQPLRFGLLGMQGRHSSVQPAVPAA